MKNVWTLIIVILGVLKICGLSEALDFSIIGKDADSITRPLYLTKDDLIFGDILIEGERKRADRIELSLDGGKSWMVLVEGGWRFVYRFKPKDKKLYRVILRGLVRGKTLFVTNVYEIYYHDTTNKELINALLNRLESSYEEGNTEEFISCFAKEYGALERLKRCLEYAFKNFRNIKLSWKIVDKEIIFDKAKLRVAWEKEWKRGKDEVKMKTSGETLFQLIKEKEWKIVDFTDKERIFLVGIPDLEVKDIVFSCEPVWGKTITLKAKVENIGDGEARGVCVRFYDNYGKIGEDRYLNLIPEQDRMEVSVDWLVRLPSPHTIKVVVDEVEEIEEWNEENNYAERTVQLALPDLSISCSDISVNKEGITLVIQNKGKAPVSEVTVRVWNVEKGLLITDQKIFSIPPENKTTLTIPILSPPRTLKIKIDPEDSIPEIDEENNEATLEIF